MTPAAERSRAGARLGAAASLVTRRAEKAEGLAFARRWREAHRGHDWRIPDGARAVCAACGQVRP